MKAMQKRTTARSRRGFGILIALLAAAPAAAQQSDQAVEFQSFRVPGWSFTPSVAFGTIYDTNVALTAPRASLGETQGDTLVTVVPGGQLEFIGRRTDFSLNYRGFVRRYVEIEGLDGYDQRASFSMRRAMTRRLSIFARDSFSDSPTTDEIEVNGVPFRRTGTRTNTFSAGSDYRLSKFTTLATRYDSTSVTFERPDLFLTGGWIHGLRNELTYQLADRIALGGEYGYRRASLNEGQREFGFQDAGGVARVTLGRHSRASVAAGFALLQDLNLDQSRNGPYVRFAVTHDLPLATIGAAFERQYVPSFGFGGSNNSQELRGHVTMPLPQRGLYTQVSAAWRRTMPFESQSLELDTTWLRSTVGYTTARWMRLEALYTFTRQDSIVTGGEVNRHRVGVQAVVSQPMRIP